MVYCFSDKIVVCAVVVQVDDHRNGSYGVSYTPQSSGMHKVKDREVYGCAARHALCIAVVYILYCTISYKSHVRGELYEG